MSAVLYLLVGLFGAWTLQDLPTVLGPDAFQALFRHYMSNHIVVVIGFIWLTSLVASGIPIYSVIIRYNLLHAEVTTSTCNYIF